MVDDYTTSTTVVGRVQMYDSDNGWGDFLSSGMHDSEAHVICIQLGYAGGTVSSRFSNGDYYGLHWCFNRACLGREHFLFECELTSNCADNGEDATVKCFEPKAAGTFLKPEHETK